MLTKKIGFVALLFVIIISCTSEIRAGDTHLETHYLPFTNGMSTITVVTQRGYIIEHQLMRSGTFYITLSTKEFEDNKDGELYLFVKRTKSFRKMIMSSWPTPDSKTRDAGSRVVGSGKHKICWVLEFNKPLDLPKLLEENVYTAYGKLEKVTETFLH